MKRTGLLRRLDRGSSNDRSFYVKVAEDKFLFFCHKCRKTILLSSRQEIEQHVEGCVKVWRGLHRRGRPNT